MAAVYLEGAGGWQLLAPQGFPNERTLQELVASAPDLLPLSGSPRVVVLGREVAIGSGIVDVLAIEATGRPVLVEVKLRTNAESRRAVVAQVLSYAAGLHGMPVEQFTDDLLERHLGGRPLLDFVRETAQAETADDFRRTLESALLDGRFRLVLVLDQAPPDLIRLVGYLEAVTEGLVIDLITVSSYDINGQRVVVPQRVEPSEQPAPAASRPVNGTGAFFDGVEPFSERAALAPEEHRPALRKMTSWAERIQRESLADVGTYFGKRGEAVLLPRLLPEGAGLASLYCRADGRPAVQLWRSVFERRAPASIDAVSAAAGTPIAQGNFTQTITDELLGALHAAYREAAS